MSGNRSWTIGALLAVALLVAGAGTAWAQIGSLAGVEAGADVDPRWLPWLGCWELEGDRVGDRDLAPVVRRLVCVEPRPDGRGVGVSTYVDGVLAFEESLIADGERHPIAGDGCEGWQLSRWSADGRRLFGRSAHACEEGGARAFEGVSMILEDGVWLDIQAADVGELDHQELLVRRYRRARRSAVDDLGLAAPAQRQELAAATARTAAAAPLSIDDVVEASEWLPAAALEAMILESGSTFVIDADALIRLDEAGIDGRVVDLVVAVSFPDRFVVDRGEIDELEPTYHGYGEYPAVGYGYPYGYPYRYGYGYSAYFHDPFFTPFHFGVFRGFPFTRRFGVRVRPGPSGSLFGGRVVKGRGYARVRSNSNNGGGGFFGRLLDGSIGSSGRIRGSDGTDGSSAGGSGGAKATPKGFTKGGSSGRRAVPRGGKSGKGGKGKGKGGA